MFTSTLVCADTFQLKSGGRVEGAWLNSSAAPVQQYVVETAAGIRITLNARDVESIVRSATTTTGFAKRAAGFPDTADGQWRLAQWCLEMGMKQQRQTALERVVALEPHHPEARKALGHHWHRGRWVSPNQHRIDQGMVRHEGRWQYKQELEFAAQQQEQEERAKKWRKTLRRLRARVDAAGGEEALAKIVAVRDPLAIPALLDLLEGESARRLRREYVQTIGKIPATAAVRALSRIVMEAPLDDAYDEAIRLLQKRVTPDLVEQFVKHLSSNDNAKVNRAAMVLGELQDPSAASPLIDALVTKHWRRRTNALGSTRRTFVEPVQKLKLAGSDVPEFEFRRVADQDDIVWETRRNEEVLRALCSLVGDQGFGFRQGSWRVWHNALLNIRRQEQLRRGE